MTNTNKQTKAIEYLTYIITPMCKFPEDIQISFTIDERGLLLDLYANDRDLSRIIGKKGIIAWSIRNIMRIWGQSNDAIVKVLIKGQGMSFYRPRDVKERDA